MELDSQDFLDNHSFYQNRKQHGLVLIKGTTDPIRLRILVAIMSNQMTGEQTKLFAEYAQEKAANRVGVMHDADAAEDEGAKDSLWRIDEVGVDASLVWSRRLTGGKYAERQTESLTKNGWWQLKMKASSSFTDK